jgi:hypothetical protein
MFQLADLQENIRRFFGEEANQVAQKTGFVRRVSKVTGAHWLQTWVFGFLETPTASLNQLAQMSEDLGVALTAQGLDERLTAAVVPFMAEMFRKGLELFRQSHTLAVEVLDRFQEVYLLDSTYLALPDNLQSAFPGNGGEQALAGLKVQLLVELRRGAWFLTMEAGNRPDQAYVPVSPLEAQTLRIGDLGYFNLETFAELARHDAYFLSRLTPRSILWEPTTGKSLDLLKQLQATAAPVLDRTVLLGAEARLPVRLIAVRVPPDVADNRRRRARAERRRKGRTVKARTLALLDWQLHVTNVPPERLSAAEVGCLYRVRWQIELIFKVWKSEAWLGRIAGWNQPRVLCELYAKLIGLLLTQLWSAPWRGEDGELSLTKVYQCVQHYALRLAQSLNAPLVLARHLERLQALWCKFGRKTKHKTRPTTLEKLRQLSTSSGSLA